MAIFQSIKINKRIGLDLNQNIAKNPHNLNLMDFVAENSEKTRREAIK
jgi:hypothetical protein